MHPIIYKIKELTEEYKKRGYSNPLIKNLIREYLQDIVISIIYNDNRFNNLIFYGGTCLRKIYNINRLSQDLDFESLEDIDLDILKDTLLRYFEIEKLDNVSASIQKNNNINMCTLKFMFLNDLGLSNFENEKLYIKIEINRSKIYIAVL